MATPPGILLAKIAGVSESHQGAPGSSFFGNVGIHQIVGIVHGREHMSSEPQVRPSRRAPLQPDGHGQHFPHGSEP
jgi:hypothetical protein